MLTGLFNSVTMPVSRLCGPAKERDNSHRKGGNRKRSEQSTYANKNCQIQCFRLLFAASLETMFSIAICRQSGDKLQSKSLLLANFDLRSSIVLTFPIVLLSNRSSANALSSSLVRAFTFRMCYFSSSFLTKTVSQNRFAKFYSQIFCENNSQTNLTTLL